MRQLLSTDDEIISNSIWRFLALREYVDQNHNLTAWGKVLATIVAELESNRGPNESVNPELEEAAVIAVELLRLGMLNADAAMFPYDGAPIRGSGKTSFGVPLSRLLIICSQGSPI